MVSWAKLDAGRVTYYENTVARGREEYYAGSGEAQGRWTGEGARALGLAGELEDGALTRLASGQHPATGERIRQTAGARSEVGAYDFTFSAPKSVSLLYACGDRDVSARVLAAHETAVQRALDVLEREAVFVRRGKGGRERERAQLIVAAFRHRTSRAGDPQLHTHAIVANWAQGRDGRFTALDSIALRDFKMALGAAYQAELRAQVTELGLRWRPLNSKGLAELECVPTGTLREFSKRRRDIEEQAKASLDNAAAMAQTAKLTRQGKRMVDMPAVERQVAAALGPELIADVADQTREAHLGTRVPNDLDRLAGPEGLTMMRNTFDRNDAIVAIARGAPQGKHAHDLVADVDRFLTRPDVIELQAGRYTTQNLLDAERARESAQRDRRASRVAVVAPKALRDGVRGLSLNSGQQAAVEAVLTSGNGVDLIQAQAGTGKTYTMSAVRRAAEADGRTVIGCAPTARAARELEAQAGIESYTLDSLVRRLDRGDIELGRRHVIVVDEAGMVPTRLGARLEQHAGLGDAKVIEIGDHRQLQSVLAGSARNLAVAEAKLDEVVRQRALEDRRIAGLLHAGHVLPWIEHQERSERLHWDAELPAAVETYKRHVAELGPEQVAFIAPTNAMVRAANELVRGGDHPLEVGDRVACRRNDQRLQVVNGDRGTIVRVTGAGVDVELDSGVKRALPRSYIEEGHLQLGYCQTIHTAQGATVERTVIAARADEMYAELAYVAATRARDSTELFVLSDVHSCDDREEVGPVSHEREPVSLVRLSRAMSTSRADVPALEQLPQRDLGMDLEL